MQCHALAPVFPETKEARRMLSHTEVIYIWTHTTVSGPCTKLYSLSISMRAIFTPSRANLLPIQLRWPQPKGMWANCGRCALASGVNLRLSVTKPIQNWVFIYHSHSPLRIKFMRVWPILRHVVDDCKWESYNSSLRYSYTTNSHCLATVAMDPTYIQCVKW